MSAADANGMGARVGIVMLVYNRADVSTLCLESLARAQTHVPFEVFVLDNASRPDESAAVEATFRELHEAGRLRGTYRRSATNLGFPGGNNVGFRELLAAGNCTHVCMLNSDVVVTDWWLDRLLAHGADAIGPTTNACGNEQTVPVATLPAIGTGAIAVANELCARRWRIFSGCLMPTTFLGFFCFVMRIEVLSDVGFLDERFGRGGYEDDDYCIRMARAGWQMMVARDVFVLHWGTASFSQIPRAKLNRHLRRGRRKLERKYGRPWQERKLLPVRGVLDDLRWMARASERDPALADEYATAATAYLTYLQQAQVPRMRPSLWARIARLAERPPLRALKRLAEFAWVLVRHRPIVVLGRGHPAAETPLDGYFQRVQLIDRELAERWRIYLRLEEPLQASAWCPGVIKVTPLSYEVHCRPGSRVHAFALALMVLLAGRIYVHSVLRLRDGPSARLFRLARRRVLDLHGVVPEEFAFHGDEQHAQVFGALEAQAVERATLLVVVSRAMQEHLQTKYGARLRAQVVCLPMLPKREPWRVERALAGERTGVLYCGGLHKWQQLDKMLALVHRRHAAGDVTFLVTDPEQVRARYRELHGTDFPGVVTSVPSAEVDRWQAASAYGLALREDVVVNHVSCPTKLVEYLRNGLVPILDTPRIGDFVRNGLQYVPLDQALPSAEERRRMAEANVVVLRRLQAEYVVGAEQLRQHL